MNLLRLCVELVGSFAGVFLKLKQIFLFPFFDMVASQTRRGRDLLELQCAFCNGLFVGMILALITCDSCIGFCLHTLRVCMQELQKQNLMPLNEYLIPTLVVQLFFLPQPERPSKRQRFVPYVDRG